METKKAFSVGLFLDAILLFIGSILIDGGVLFVTILNAVLASLAIAAYIMIRRSKAPTKMDLIWIRSGSVFMIPVSVAATIYFLK